MWRSCLRKCATYSLCEVLASQYVLLHRCHHKLTEPQEPPGMYYVSYSKKKISINKMKNKKIYGVFCSTPTRLQRRASLSASCAGCCLSRCDGRLPSPPPPPPSPGRVSMATETHTSIPITLFRQSAARLFVLGQ